ncbi:carbohydrate kinase family protein [Anaerobium acetethylicum]|uniref:Sugar or nucleoside kinase, ribokinase family n=1 Tax=Anaerobium acetethylicum TaxID=1619234 RepID=A0A1D3TTG0_9FIRM|nr:PfkB family carbohydrate kinase [Anaerobium acetethylicum]SCP97250.1 Sugar or nucleoside kinase, ribokinase family [Anaerobium acetethylicum]
MDYVVGSTAVTDELHFPDGKVMNNLAGGAGIYALAGIRLWCDSVEIVTGVGEDYADIYGDWYKKNNLSMNGLRVRAEKTPHNVITYFEDGERDEVPLYGADHYLSVEARPEDLEGYFETSKGIYIFKNSNSAFWDRILEMKKRGNARVMWEIASDAATFENKDEVKKIAGQIDVFSINRTEAFSLLKTNDMGEVIEEFKKWNIPLIFLRRGKDGAYMIAGGGVFEALSLKDISVVDATGGGNSSSAAVLYGFCEGRSPLEAGLMGSISAAMCLAQYGVPAVIDSQMRHHANDLLKKMMEEIGRK